MDFKILVAMSHPCQPLKKVKTIDLFFKRRDVNKPENSAPLESNLGTSMTHEKPSPPKSP